MGNICLFKTKAHWSNESFMFWWFTSEVLADKTYLVNSSFPTFALSFSWANNFEHFCFTHWFYFFDWYIPFTCFFFTLLFDHICEDLWIFLLLSVHKISWNSSIFNWFSFSFSILLFVLFNSFLHLNFLFESFFVKDLSLNTSQWLCLLWNNFCFSSLFFSTLLLCV